MLFSNEMEVLLNRISPKTFSAPYRFYPLIYHRNDMITTMELGRYGNINRKIYIPDNSAK
jgi:hypothetical protein